MIILHFFWTVITENLVFQAKVLNIYAGVVNQLFLQPQLSFKSKKNTYKQLIGCSVYQEITQISERSL